jgi:hypothetical protein
MEKEMIYAAPHHTAAFFSLVNHPLKLKLYLLMNVPAAFFSGVRVTGANDQFCTVSVPFIRFTKNPFRSTYFACLSMAAELSTGVLAMANVYKRKPAVSLLITGMEARFRKKATGTTFFTCRDGEKIREAVAAAIRGKEGQEVSVYSVGKNEKEEVVAEFWFTWSFRTR